MALLKENPEGNLPCAKLRLLELEIYNPSIEDLDLISELVIGRYTKGLPLRYQGNRGRISAGEGRMGKYLEAICRGSGFRYFYAWYVWRTFLSSRLMPVKTTSSNHIPLELRLSCKIHIRSV
jgi:hypothetical protein